MLKKNISMLTMVLLGCLNSFAQQQEHDYNSIMGISVSSGYQMTDFGNLNQALAKYGYPELSNNCYKFSGGLVLVADDSIDYHKGYAYITNEVGYIGQTVDNAAHIATSAQIINYLLNVNVNYLLKKNYYFSPVAGVGFSQTTIKLSNNGNSYNSFDSTLAHISQETEIKTKNLSFLINVGAGISKRFPARHGDFLLSLKAGYLFQLNRATLYTTDINSPLSGSPRINVGGFYASLVLAIY